MKKLNHVFLNTTKTCYFVEYDNARVYYSYETPQMIWFYNDDVVFQTKTKYSVTTSEQITKYIKPYISKDINLVEQDVFNKLLSEVK